MLKRKIHTKGRITVESCICSFILIFILLLSIQINGYIKTYSDLLSQLDKRLNDTAVTYHLSGTYLIDIITKIEVHNIDNVRYIAVPYDHFFTLAIHADYDGVLLKSSISVQTASAKWSGDGIKNIDENIWELDPFKRGEAIHYMMGANLDRNFPTLDIYDPYSQEAVSIISINTQDDSYKSGSDLKKKIKQQIDAVNQYSYGEYGGYSICEEDINIKTVVVVIPAAKLNNHQTKQINDMFTYANSMGINLEVKKFQ
ncbi:MAG TPA: hypothetical protein PK870_06955 [Clostridia bacterium]|nr:hypothetical protein [Clostridia bacterium]